MSGGLPRLAFVHLMRTAGTFVNAWMAAQYQSCHQSFHNSWAQGLERDWTPSELRGFLRRTGSQYVHNHVLHWDGELVDEYRRHGFRVFTFVRHPGDQLCSLYNWLHERLGGEISLEEFLVAQLSSQSCMEVSPADWAIPDYVHRLDEVFCYEAGIEAQLKLLLPRCVVGQATMGVVNGSSSPGFAVCCEQGLISSTTAELLNGSDHMLRYRRILQRK